MKRILTLLAAVGLGTGACADSTNNSSLSTLASAFQSVPVGFDNAQHSFAGSPGGDAGNPEGGPHGDRGGPDAATTTIMAPVSARSWAAGSAACSSATAL